MQLAFRKSSSWGEIGTRKATAGQERKRPFGTADRGVKVVWIDECGKFGFYKLTSKKIKIKKG
jgi:hypothetical protein